MSEALEALEPQKESDAIDSAVENVKEVIKAARPEKPEIEEPKAEKDPEPEPKKDEGQIPLAKHIAERNRIRQQASAEMEALKQEIASLREAMMPKQEAPNPEEDPFGALAHQIKQAEAKVDNLNEANQQTRELLQRAEAQRQIVEMENLYKARNADYEAAINHLRDQRFALYELMGIPEEQHEASFAAETQRFLQATLASGADPFEAAFKMAELQGFKAKTRETKQTADAGNEKIAAAASLSSVNGKAPPDEADAEDVNSLSDREFDKMFSGPDGDANWRRIAGG